MYLCVLAWVFVWFVFLPSMAFGVGERIGGGVKVYGGVKTSQHGPPPTDTPTPVATATPTPTWTPGGPTATPTGTPTPTPTVVSSEPIYPEQQFTYLGAFRPPTQGTYGADNWNGAGDISYAGMSMGTDNTKLYVVGPDGDSVGEIVIPTPVITTNQSSMNRATHTGGQNFTDISGGGVPQGIACSSSSHLCQADIVPYGGKLWTTRWLQYSPPSADDTIATSSFPTLGTFDTGWAGIDDGSGHVHAGRHSKYIFELPATWKTNIGYPLCTGRFRSQAQSFGPSLYCFDADTAPTNATDLDAIKLIHYPSEPSIPGHNSNSRYDDAAWITAGAYEAFMVCGSVSPWEYYKATTCSTGLPNGVAHECTSGQTGGYGGPPFYGQCWLYKPDDILAVKNQTLSASAIQPYRKWIFNDVLFDALPGPRCVNTLTALAWNPTDRLLYISHTPTLSSDGSSVRAPIFHVFRVETTQTGTRDTSGPSVPVPTPAVAASQSCTLSWSASTDDTKDMSGAGFTTDGITYRILRDHIRDNHHTSPCPPTPTPPIPAPRWDTTNDFKHIAMKVGGTSYVDTVGLTNGTTYNYKIEAMDRVGNVSAQSSAVSCTPN